MTKRYVIAATAHNLGRILRKLFGVGKPRTLQDLADLASLAQRPIGHGWRYCRARFAPRGRPRTPQQHEKNADPKSPYFPGLLAKRFQPEGPRFG